MHYPYGYGEENDWCVRARIARWELRVATSVHVFHEKSASFGVEKREQLKKLARAASKSKYTLGQVREAEKHLKRSCGLVRAREVARRQYTGWRAKFLAAQPNAILTLAEGDAASTGTEDRTNTLGNSYSVPKSLSLINALHRSTHIANTLTMRRFLSTPIFDYIVSTGPKSAAIAQRAVERNKRLVHVKTGGEWQYSYQDQTAPGPSRSIRRRPVPPM